MLRRAVLRCGMHTGEQDCAPTLAANIQHAACTMSLRIDDITVQPVHPKQDANDMQKQESWVNCHACIHPAF